MFYVKWIFGIGITAAFAGKLAVACRISFGIFGDAKDKVAVKRAFGDGFVLIHDESTIFRNIRNHILHRTKHTVHIDILSAAGGNEMNSGFGEPTDKF